VTSERSRHRARLRRRHLEEHPTCAYGDEPHFVPPSFGQVGFYLCDPPADLTNHSRAPVPPSDLIYAAKMGPDGGAYVLLRFQDPERARAFIWDRATATDGRVVDDEAVAALLQVLRDYGGAT
jgi:hypothetical protein